YYYNLMRVFAGVPLITKVLNTGDPELFTPRSTRTGTVDFILQDLADASVDLPQQGELEAGEIGRITRGAALALTARIALFEGTWQKFHGEANANKYLDAAITAANAVMNSGQYGLYTGSGAQSYRY